MPPLSRSKGGFQRPIQLSVFMRDQLSSGLETYGLALYEDYKTAMQSIPAKQGRAKRRVISYGGFRTYLYVFRRLGLIEYVTDAKGKIKEEVAMDSSHAKDAPYLMPRKYFRAAPGRLDDSAWINPWFAYRGY